jgi:hypothetical protein
MRNKWPVSAGRLPLAKGMLLPIYAKAQSETRKCNRSRQSVTADQESITAHKPLTL